MYTAIFLVLFAVCLYPAHGFIAGKRIHYRSILKTERSISLMTSKSALEDTNFEIDEELSPTQFRMLQLTEKILEKLDNNDPEYVAQLLERLLDDNSNQIPSSDMSPDSLFSDDAVLNGVVRIYCTHSEPNFNMPWQRQKQEFSTSSGFVLSGQRILTNAHAVEYGSLIQVKKRQSETKYVARVVAVGHECDLAVLEIDDPTFWNDITELQFGDLPELLDDVSVIGYPVGGDSISITSGVVSRIEMQEYAQASADLLAIQIDAAINPGNSGGPVFNARNEVIGVAFQSLSEEDIENIGYVVPISVIQHFLQTIEGSRARIGRARYAVCTLGVRLQALESKALRSYLKMQPQDTGVRVTGLAPLSPANQTLQVNDVLLSVDGIEIGNDGTIPFREGSTPRRERVHLNYYFTQKFEGDVVQLQILREGKYHKVEVPVWVSQPLIPRNLLMPPAASAYATAETASVSLGRTPSYLIAGGLVFLTLTREYMESEFKVKHMSEFDSWHDEFTLLAQSGATRSVPQEEVVILSEVLVHPCNIGYEHHRNLRIVQCNGVRVTNLRHLRKLVDDALQQVSMDETPSSSPLLTFTCHGGAIMVLNAAEVYAAQQQICQEHFIPSPYSPDLIE